MKRILKQTQPQALAEWRASANEDWQPTYDNLDTRVKRKVKASLMEEQGWICCYCERKLTENDSHIEHFRPQKDPAVDPLDYDNLLCSCQNQDRRGEPIHCGHSKGGWFDPALLINPLKNDCEERFSFLLDGAILPRHGKDPAAKTTIAKLNLDIPKLRALRRAAVTPFLEVEMSTDEWRAFVDQYLEKDTSGTFNEFWSTIRHLFQISA